MCVTPTLSDADPVMAIVPLTRLAAAGAVSATVGGVVSAAAVRSCRAIQSRAFAPPTLPSMMPRSRSPSSSQSRTTRNFGFGLSASGGFATNAPVLLPKKIRIVPPLWCATRRSARPSLSMSAMATSLRPGPIVAIVCVENVPSPSAKSTSSRPLFDSTDAMSGMPSALRSPVATALVGLPPPALPPSRNVPSPFPRKT